jgi:hypothetical protein
MRKAGRDKERAVETTISFQNSRGEQESRTFEIIASGGLSLKEKAELISAGFQSVTRGDWQDEDFAKIEKQAARAVGLNPGDKFLVKFW